MVDRLTHCLIYFLPEKIPEASQWPWMDLHKLRSRSDQNHFKAILAACPLPNCYLKSCQLGLLWVFSQLSRENRIIPAWQTTDHPQNGKKPELKGCLTKIITHQIQNNIKIPWNPRHTLRFARNSYQSRIWFAWKPFQPIYVKVHHKTISPCTCPVGGDESKWMEPLL